MKTEILRTLKISSNPFTLPLELWLVEKINIDVPPETQICCAHVATIHDKSYRGSDSSSQLNYAWNVDHIAAISGIGVGEDYEETPESHMLAYCLILTSTGTKDLQYQRIGMRRSSTSGFPKLPTLLFQYIKGHYRDQREKAPLDSYTVASRCDNKHRKAKSQLRVITRCCSGFLCLSRRRDMDIHENNPPVRW